MVHATGSSSAASSTDGKPWWEAAADGDEVLHPDWSETVPKAAKKCVKKWALLPPYDTTITAEQWQNYYDERKELDLAQATSQDVEQGDDSECPGSGPTKSIVLKLGRMVFGGTVPEELKEDLAGGLRSSFYNKKTTLSWETETDPRSVDALTVLYSPFGLGTSVQFKYSYYYDMRLHQDEYFPSIYATPCSIKDTTADDEDEEDDEDEDSMQSSDTEDSDDGPKAKGKKLSYMVCASECNKQDGELEDPIPDHTMRQCGCDVCCCRCGNPIIAAFMCQCECFCFGTCSISADHMETTKLAVGVIKVNNLDLVMRSVLGGAVDYFSDRLLFDMAVLASSAHTRNEVEKKFTEMGRKSFSKLPFTKLPTIKEFSAVEDALHQFIKARKDFTNAGGRKTFRYTSKNLVDAEKEFRSQRSDGDWPPEAVVKKTRKQSGKPRASNYVWVQG